jgi:hypothetical protein
VWGKLVSKSLQILFKEYPSLQKDQLWLTYKKEKKEKERVKKREGEKNIDKRKQKKK